MPHGGKIDWCPWELLDNHPDRPLLSPRTAPDHAPSNAERCRLTTWQAVTRRSRRGWSKHPRSKQSTEHDQSRIDQEPIKSLDHDASLLPRGILGGKEYGSAPRQCVICNTLLRFLRAPAEPGVRPAGRVETGRKRGHKRRARAAADRESGLSGEHDVVAVAEYENLRRAPDDAFKVHHRSHA